MKHLPSTILFLMFLIAFIGIYYGNPTDVAWAKYAAVVFISSSFICLAIESRGR